jgi:hypothetical protein
VFLALFTDIHIYFIPLFLLYTHLLKLVMGTILLLVFEHAVHIFFAINLFNNRKYTGTYSSALLQSMVTDNITV